MRYWKRVDLQGKTTTVESYSYNLEIDKAIGIEKAEFDTYIASLPIPTSIPIRDLSLELDNLKAEVNKLKLDMGKILTNQEPV